jgi:hypothetical protein
MTAQRCQQTHLNSCSRFLEKRVAVIEWHFRSLLSFDQHKLVTWISAWLNGLTACAVRTLHHTLLVWRLL